MTMRKVAYVNGRLIAIIMNFDAAHFRVHGGKYGAYFGRDARAEASVWEMLL